MQGAHTILSTFSSEKQCFIVPKLETSNRWKKARSSLSDSECYSINKDKRLSLCNLTINFFFKMRKAQIMKREITVKLAYKS